MSFNKGYIKTYRSDWNHPLLKPGKVFSQLEAWLWLKREASFAERDVQVWNGRRLVTVHLLPGQLTHSIRYLMREWGWGNNRISDWLTALQAEGLISVKTQTATQTTTQTATQTATAQTIITICDLDENQAASADAETQTATQTTTHTVEQTATNNKKGIRRREYSEGFEAGSNSIARPLSVETPEGNAKGGRGGSKRSLARPSAAEATGFDEWYTTYPLKVDKHAALKAYGKIISGGIIGADDLLARTKVFAAQRAKEDPKFTPYPATWLNGRRFEDQAVIDAAKAAVPSNKAMTDEDWEPILGAFKGCGTWSEDAFGPRPGAAGCMVPQHLLSFEGAARPLS